MPANYDGEYSHYQGLFGLYELNGNYIDREMFDGRPYYYRPDLAAVDENDWHILWFDEHDSWVVNDYIPTDTEERGGHVFYYESWCHTNIPNNCSGTWPLYQGYEDIDAEDSDVIMFAVEAGSAEAANCMPEPDEEILVTGTANLCFDDGENAEADNPLSGTYSLIDITYNDRYAWVMDAGLEGEMFLYYDASKRFWVIGSSLGDDSYFTNPYFEAYCLQWDQLQPFGCETWYSYRTTADEMPDRFDDDERTSSMSTMRVSDECSDSSSAMGASDDDADPATSAGAIVGYVLAALVLFCFCAWIFCDIRFCDWFSLCECKSCRSCREKGQHSFQSEPQGGSLAGQQTGGISAGGMQKVDSPQFVEMNTPKADDQGDALPATAGADAMRSDSVTMDGDGMDTK